MIRHFKNIDTAFDQIKRFCYLFLALNALCIGYSLYHSRNAEKVHILYNGKLLEAFSTDRKQNLGVELRDHVKTFHEYFFNLVPDDKAIEAGVTKAFYLADTTAIAEYRNLKEHGYYNNLVAASVSQQVTVDSIKLSGTDFPYQFTCFITEQLKRSSNTEVRKLVTGGQLIDLHQETERNPHGFLISGWHILANTP